MRRSAQARQKCNPIAKAARIGAGGAAELSKRREKYSV